MRCWPMRELRAWIGRVGAAATPVPGAYFDSLAGESNLKKQLKVSELGGFGSFTRAELAAIGAVLKYVELTQMGRAPSLRPPKRSGSRCHSAHRCGEPRQPGAGAIGVGREAGQPARRHRSHGHRRRRARAGGASGEPACGTWRASIAGSTRSGSSSSKRRLRADLRAALKSAPDIARAVSRLGFGRGSPRDLAAVRDGLDAASRCADLLAGEGAGMGLPEELSRVCRRAARSRLRLCKMRWRRRSSTIRRISSATAASCAQGYRAELDEARRLKEDGRGVMAGLEARYVERTGVKSLKVRHNNILGFYIEVTQGNAKPLLEAPLVGRVPPPPDDGQRRALLDGRADRHRGAHRLGQRARAEPRAGDLRRAGNGDRARAPRPRPDRRRIGRTGRDRGAGRAGAYRGLCAARRRRAARCSKSAAAAIRWSSRRCEPPRPAPSSRTIACSAAERSCRRARTPPPGASGWSPGRTWPASRRSCARTR